MQEGSQLAAIDLGSNSFRLEVGRLEHGQIQRIQYLKETVRQGGELDAERNLSPAALQRGWDCLARFAERLHGFAPEQVRAVATQTLREARNRDQFLQRAQQVLGFAIDIISGPEEARLIYLGVAHLLAQADERRLVVDIGGRSTEMIIGRGLQPLEMASYRCGSVAWSMRYFDQGLFSAAAFEQAEVAAAAVLDEALGRFHRQDWDVAYGASGTVGAVGELLAGLGYAPGVITRRGLDALREALIAARSAQRLRLSGLREDRRAVIGGGLAVLRAVFDLLGLTQMQVAAGALRQGVLFDLLSRVDPPTDLRESTVQRLARRFAVDAAQAQRVSRVAQGLLAQLLLGVGPQPAQARLRKLGWAAQLHEVGQAISHSDAHKHGAYILRNADALGFAQHELDRLALLVLGHKGKLRKLEADWADPNWVQALISLRLAVLLCHARSDPEVSGLVLKASLAQRQFSLSLPPGWASRFPQSAHLLREEGVAWQKTPWRFSLD